MRILWSEAFLWTSLYLTHSWVWSCFLFWSINQLYTFTWSIVSNTIYFLTFCHSPNLYSIYLTYCLLMLRNYCYIGEFIYFSLCSYFFLFIFLSNWLFICLSDCPSIHLHACLFVISINICLSICLLPYLSLLRSHEQIYGLQLVKVN